MYGILFPKRIFVFTTLFCIYGIPWRYNHLMCTFLCRSHKCRYKMSLKPYFATVKPFSQMYVCCVSAQLAFKTGSYCIYMYCCFCLYDNIQWHYTFFNAWCWLLSSCIHRHLLIAGKVLLMLSLHVHSWCIWLPTAPHNAQPTISQIENMLQYSQMLTYLYTEHRHTRIACTHSYVYSESLCYG